ncbi:MAG TPA: hypothetical protein VEA38_04080 [Terriglobales bacterium]|nr:hypothetical protein [Terriglobales bacterium]
MSATATVPLALAVVCADCDNLREIDRGTCPVCASDHAHPVAAWIPSLTTPPEGGTR